MPRTAIPVTKPAGGNVAQPAATAGDAANDHHIENDGQTILQVKNTDSVSRTIVIVTAQTVGSPAHAVDDDSYVVAAGDTRIIGPFNPGLYGQPTDSNRVHINLAETTWELRAFSSAL